MNKNFLLIFSILFISFHVCAIRITTEELEEIYGGPGESIAYGWSSPTNPTKYDKYHSTGIFIVSPSREQYYDTLIQEEFKAPKFDVLRGTDIISPHLYGDGITGYLFDGTSYWEELPEIYFYFNCQKNGEAVVSITIETTLTYEEGDGNQTISDTVKFYFGKTCENNVGYREGLTIKSEKQPADVVNHGIVQSRWSVTSDVDLYKNPVVVPENEHTSVFHVSISNPHYGNEFLSPPIVFVEDDDIVDIQLRGDAQNGGIANFVPSNIILIYDCKGTGNTEITISLAIGFYGTLQFGFEKECKVTGPEEHGMSGIINVGISRNEFAGVVSNSITSLFWSVDSPTVSIPVDEISTNFYVSTLSGQTQDFLKPIITVNPPSAFEVTVSGNLREGGTATGSPQHFTVNYLCSRVSTGVVIVSLKLPGPFNTIEYAYTKQCKALRRHTGHYYTANQIMVALIFVVVAIAVTGYILYRKKMKLESSTNKKVAKP